VAAGRQTRASRISIQHRFSWIAADPGIDLSLASCKKFLLAMCNGDV
jgi:hypothetical protein